MKPISDEFVKYALNLAATNIVLLVGLYRRGVVTKYALKDGVNENGR